MAFWDYGNSFMLEASRAGADILATSESGFRYPSYVEDIMGDIFSLGFGPFRWVCTSADQQDLLTADAIAEEVMTRCRKEYLRHADKKEYFALAAPQIQDNLLWIQEADKHKLVVGSQARILYANAQVRSRIGVAFNAAVASGRISAPVMLSRDHHDVSGTDSPWRETSNIRDGSQFTADMAVQNVIGDSFRGATSVSLHNGGGTGWGESINGGFLLCLDGSDDAARRARNMLHWDVFNGVSRRAWAGNDCAMAYIAEEQEHNKSFQVQSPFQVREELLNDLLDCDEA